MGRTKAQADSDDIWEDLGKAQQAVQTAAHHRHTGNLVLLGSTLLPQVFHLNVQTILTLEASPRV